MNPMPHIIVTAGHVGRLREQGPGGLLVWVEPHDEVVVLDRSGQPTVEGGYTLKVRTALSAKAGHIDEDLMVVAGFPGNTDGFADDAVLADHLTEQAEELYAQWPETRAMTPMVIRLRAALAEHGIHLTGPPRHLGRPETPGLIEKYRRLDDSDYEIEVATTFGHRDPVSVAAHSVFTGRQYTRFAIDVASMAPVAAAEVTAAVIERAVRPGR
ncbi:hypothetical protein CLV63_11233 [Murinocardiopsis flavida]|uniref:Uncharacterized protein n=1 Tax=Murinocardiopsis flavida TaxID=645275 RepID=A0A2P8DG11_9ACTN|nr:hypothetical protein [Murinocardiopsis flavida]PSK96151.1 hypothetical protein CLV63_11233 [Murinocardiopsis flavida]